MVDYQTKKNSLILETVVLINGEKDPELYKDSQGDVFTAEDIKRIYTTEANQTMHDIEHTPPKIDGVETISNYITTTPEIIGGRTIPVGSWRKDLLVTDDEIIQQIKSNRINGVSIHSKLRTCKTCQKELDNIQGQQFYNKDITNKECILPRFVSLVNDPANMTGMNVYSYEKFLTKNKNKTSKNIKRCTLNNIITSKKIGDNRMNNKFSEMLKGFGESVLGYAECVDENPEPVKKNPRTKRK